MLDLLGVAGGGTWAQSNAEQERPYLTAWSGKDRGYKAGRLKSADLSRRRAAASPRPGSFAGAPVRK
jgi:hypothetical protein